MSRNSEEYFSAVDDLTGGGGRFFQITNKDETPLVAVASYDGVPEKGEITSFSYGLSSIARPEWKNSRPELIISVRSADDAWALCMGEIIRCHRMDSTFSYGTILHFRQTIADESKMTSFLVFACTLLDDADLRVSLPDRVICFSQLYPIYESEVDVINQMGVEAFFWETGIDFSDVRRTALEPK